MHGFWMACIYMPLFLSANPCLRSNREEQCIPLYSDRKLAIHTVTAHVGSAEIRCPDVKEQENITISLHKESTLLHSTLLTTTQNTSEPKQRFHIYTRNETVHYLIDNLQVNDTGLYYCSALHRTTHMLLLVKETIPCSPEGKSYVWIVLPVGCGLVALYSLMTTIVTCYFGWKLRGGITFQSDYYNTKPGEFSQAR